MPARIVVQDQVQVMAGSAKGKVGIVKRVYPKLGRVEVENVAVQKRHRKANTDKARPEAHIGEKMGHIAISNVMPIDPETKKPTRVRFEVRDGKKVRIAKSGAVLPQVQR